MWRAVLANVRANGSRLLLTFTATLIGATFVSSSIIFADSLARGHTGIPGDLDVLVSAAEEGGESSGADGAVADSVRAQLAAMPGVAAATGVVDGYAAPVGHDGKVILTRGFDVRMSGSNWTGTERMRLDEGRAPTGEREVALAGRLAEAGSVKLGETIRVLHGTGSVEAAVTGFYTYAPHGREEAAAPAVAFDTTTAQRLLLSPGRFSAVHLTATPGQNARDLAEAATRMLPPELTALDRDRLAADLTTQERSLTASVQGTALTFAVISLLVGSTLITNTFAMLITRRSRELALLRAVGATRGQTRRWVLAEAAVIGVTGSVTGFLAGIALAYPALGYASTFDPTLAGTVVVGWIAPVVTVVAGVLVTVLSAWLPARRASRIPPAAALRVAPQEAAYESRWRRRLGKVIAVPAVLLLLGGAAGTGDGFGLVGFLGAILSLPAVLLLVPVLSRPAVRLLSRRLRSRAAPSLAMQNIQRSPRRTAATASALLIGVALTTGIGIFAASITAQALTDMTASLDGDLVIYNVSGGPVSSQSRDRLAAVPGVGAVTPVREATLDLNGEPTRTGTIEPSAIGVTVIMDLAGARPDDLRDGAFVARETAGERGWSIGQELVLESPRGGRQPVRIAAIVPDTSLLGDVVLPPSVADRHFPDDEGNPVLVALADGADLDEVERGLTAAVADRPDLRVVTPETYVRSLITEVDAFLGVSGGLLGLSLLIAFLGIINTLTLSVTERLREIGLLRAIGMSRGQVRAMVCTESLVLAVIGGVLGLFVGMVFGAMAQHLVLTRPVFEIQIPFTTIGLCVAGLIAGGLAAAIWPAQRAAGTSILEAVAPD